MILAWQCANRYKVIAGFFTGGALAVRGGLKAARNSAIGCACLLAVIEGVGIGFQRMMAENTRLDVRKQEVPDLKLTQLTHVPLASTTTSAAIRKWWTSTSVGIIDLFLVLSHSTASQTLNSSFVTVRKAGRCILTIWDRRCMLCCIAGNGRCTLEVLWRYKDNDTSTNWRTCDDCTYSYLIRLSDRPDGSLWAGLRFN